MKVDIFNTDKKYNIIYADPPWSYAHCIGHQEHNCTECIKAYLEGEE